VLPALGFDCEPVTLTEPSGWRRQWVRDRGWARDVVDMPYRRGGESAIILNLRVDLPIGGHWTVYDGRGVPAARFPIWWAARRVEKYAVQRAQAVVSYSSWFEGFKTPARAIRSAASPDRNHPTAGPTFELMIGYLEREADRLARIDGALLAPWLAMTTDERRRQLEEWIPTQGNQETLGAIERRFEEEFAHVPGMSVLGVGLAFTDLVLAVSVQRNFDHA